MTKIICRFIIHQSQNMVKKTAKKLIKRKERVPKAPAKKTIAKKTIAKKTSDKKTIANKYIGRDKNQDKSIKINISTGGGGSKGGAPPSVMVYPQQQAQQIQPQQHLIIDRNDRSPLIDDRVGNSNLMQLMTQQNSRIDQMTVVEILKPFEIEN